MSGFVLDCSATLPWVFANEATPATDALLDDLADGGQAWVPALWHLDVANAMLGALPDVAGAPLALERILGAAMAPVCWLMGVPWHEAATAGRLMGTKTVLNEFLAYLELARTPPEALSPRSRTIMLYALCGFANLGSVGIMIGGMSAMCPARRGEIAELGMKALVAGTFCTCLLGAIVGAIL